VKLGSMMPRPKAAFPEPGSFVAPPGAAVHCPPDAESAGRRMAALLGLPLVQDGTPWTITVGSGGAGVGALGVPDRTDAYGIAVERDRIRLEANSRRGLIYAAYTLEQTGTGCGRLIDFPDLPMRGMHLDLKGPALRFGYLRSLVERLGQLKINTLLVEYEDKFPYQSAPALVGEGALSREELQELLALCQAWAIDVIPLVQCLGHTEYILKHPEYRYLAEDANLQQLCPLHGGSLPLFESMVDEVAAAHQGLTYFHMGGDESWSLGQCPRCREVAQTQGKARLYVDYIKQAAGAVAARGLKPIIWDDMFHEDKAHHLLDELPAGTALMVWEYQAYEPQTTHLRWGAQRYAARRYAQEPEQLWGWSGWLEDLPAEEQELIRTVKFGGGDVGQGDPIPWIRAIQARGREVIGASASKGADTEASLFPSYDQRYANLAVWAGRAQESGITGVVSTTWSRFNSYRPPVEPWETAWYTTLASAELYWNTRTTPEQFDERFGETEARALRWVAEGRRLHQRKYLQAALDLLPADSIAALCARQQMLAIRTEGLEHAGAWHLHYLGDPDEARMAGRAVMVQYLTELQQQWLDWQAELEQRLSVELQPAGAAELAATQAVGPVEKLTWLIGRLREQKRAGFDGCGSS
jgi:hypothetical protein